MNTRRKAHYTVRTGEMICEQIALGRSLNQALKHVGYLAPTLSQFWRWIDAHPDFRDKYERARQLQADQQADTMLEMAEDVLKNPKAATAYRVASDILRWQAEVRNRSKYGSKAEDKTPKSLDPGKLRAEIKRLENELGVAEQKVVPLKQVK